MKNQRDPRRHWRCLILALVGLTSAALLVPGTARLASAQSIYPSWSSAFGSDTTTSNLGARAVALRLVADNSKLRQQEFNRAFVLMQYFGYLRRNPNDPPEPGLNFDGYNFWLTKLNQFNGNFINAEMVKAFITSGEYRQRFGQP
jgi:hypothetical protein